MLSRATRQNKTMVAFVFDDDDGKTWPGDTDFLSASDRHFWCDESCAQNGGSEEVGGRMDMSKTDGVAS